MLVVLTQEQWDGLSQAARDRIYKNTINSLSSHGTIFSIAGSTPREVLDRAAKVAERKP